MPSGTTVTLRPNETFNQGAWWAFTGGPSTIHAATSDNSDATYATTTGNPGFVGFTDMPPIPDGARIIQVTIRVRWSGDGNAYGAVATVDNLATGEKYKWQTSYYKVPASTHTQTFAAMATRPDGTPWTVDALRYLTVRLAASGIPVHFVEVYADVLYNRCPAVTGVTPSGTLTTQQPTVGWQYDDADGDPQERWQVRVFTDAQARAASFNPATSPAAADSGTAYLGASGATGWLLPLPLAPGVYHAYVRAADRGSGGRYSEWASTTFTVVGDPPAPPALVSVAPNPARGRVEILVRQADGYLGRQTATADGPAAEHLHWYAYGNSSAPAIGAGGLDANAVTAGVTAAGEWAVTGLWPLRAIPGLTHIWAGWIKVSVAGGLGHLDAVWLDAEGVYLGLSEGGAVALATGYQPSEGRAVAPANARGVYLMWRSTGALPAGQTVSWDRCNIWPTRADPDIAGLEERLIAAEDGVVDLQIRVAQLEGIPPVITIQPSMAPIDAAHYRGGLDSRNLLGPADGSFTFTLAGTNWVKVGDGEVITTRDAAGYEGYALRYKPVVVGGSHLLRLGARGVPIPDVRAAYQLSLRHRAATASGAPVAGTLVADPSLVWLDGDGNPVGQPAGVGRQFLADGGVFSPQVGVSATPPAGAVRMRAEVALSGEAHLDDRWCFDTFQVARLPFTPPAPGFGNGPFGAGPFGGGSGTGVLPWKPTSQCDVYPLVEYSLDGGAVWAPVRHTERAAYDPTTRLARVYDYEAPLSPPGGPAVTVLYRARTAARDYQTDPVSGALVVSAPTTTRQVSLTVSGYHVVDPFTQKRVPFEHSAPGGSAVELKMEVARPTAEFNPVGRGHRFLVSDVEKGGAFDWRITLPDGRAVDEFAAMLASGRTLLVQTPTGRSWYVRPGSSRSLASVLDGARDRGGVVEFSGFEQARPPT